MQQNTGTAVVSRAGRHFIWLAGLLLLGLLFMPRAEAGLAPVDVVRAASSQVLERLESEGDALRQDPQRLYELVDHVLVEHMDFQRMSRWVLGKHWKRATPEQRQRFVEEFRTLLVRTYSSALLGYSGQQVKFLPLRAANERQVTVRTEIEQPGGPSVPVHYSLYNRNGEWKAYDVIIDGVSLVANYRATFGAEVRRGGLEQLILSLAERNRQSLAASSL
ncbi:ABC transporter substrate-binding protein [Thiohalobacter sp. IOR34]|uniref:MlaC/ttg2D family ABC transporter substrate-binding protein n=1 Tax=Thiohalobacter sp. IOR34 TaxID=3057176 RepID=UPI0025B15C6D|nr:ABC transporter substrate-binding protein [Thiohalobacter sp. IOR34]WJW75609.1 ABC transporter substrate-binding protein [Thiohalobacter sp. IOR34]